MKPKLARVERARGGNQNKIKKSGGVTPLVVIPWVRRTPFSHCLCLHRSPSLRVVPTALAQSVPASDVKETRKPGTAVLSPCLSLSLSLSLTCTHTSPSSNSDKSNTCLLQPEWWLLGGGSELGLQDGFQQQQPSPSLPPAPSQGAGMPRK